MSRIKVLPELVINQIAAGEVIERPASILKELLENSIDANSSSIRVYLQYGGKDGIKVVDNGTGIHPEDLPLVCLQHATSKITQLDDLYKTNTLGFRGEALASISSVAKINIKSQQNIPTGTTIEVTDLFYNVPVRKKFLKSKNTEFNYLQETFKKIALSNFKISFMLYNNNKLLKNLPIATTRENQEKRIAKLLGNKFVDNTIFFVSKLENMELFGWIVSNPQVSGVNAQYFYINNRVVKDKILNSAIKRAMMKPTLQPAYCLYLKLDPAWLDVNVHPTKQEVRFSDPRVVYAFVYESLIDVVSKSMKNVNLKECLVSNENQQQELDNINLKECLVSNENQRQELENHLNDETITNDNNKILGSDIRVLPVFGNKYLIFQTNNIHLAFLNVGYSLKWLMHQKMQQIDKVSSYKLVIPERITFEYNKEIDSYKDCLEALKFDIHQIHENVFLVKAIPDCFVTFDVNIDYKNFINNLSTCKLNLDNSSVFNQIIKLIITNIQIKQLDLCNKKYLINLIEQLIIENFHFSIINEREIAGFIKE